ncbi:radical SAM family heme chaperone HemW [uncultured Desulfuromonas sp.]|uniref:radical SAM family heme chaperone HemW n=1 Tax=uncultured Desulfuromonas sp. TaxID=181013 RepID=UPI002AAB5CC0|nr:radical SAM family heme chaperone HemW [uncultured Desulfuromonas sp.]
MAGLYVHIPFCRQKCPYCDFYSEIGRDTDLAIYVDAVCRDLQHSCAWFRSQPFSSVFFGGGTPSLLEPVQVERILSQVQQCYGVTADVEISMEVNPGTVDYHGLLGYRQAGVNRLSIGVQSFDDDQLRWLQRIHDSRQAISMVDEARRAGFERLNLDLMFALPGQSEATVAQSCHRVAQLGVEHVSIYGLSVEPGTPLAAAEASGRWCPSDEEDYQRQYLTLSEQLACHGFDHYEISNFCRSGEACRHNLGYWQRRPYLGIGAGAHSFLGHGDGERWHCPNDLAAYVTAVRDGRSPRQQIEVFSRDQAISEAAYLALRCRRGVDDREFLSRYGERFSSRFSQAISACGDALHHCGTRYFFEPKDWLLYDFYIEKFLM